MIELPELHARRAWLRRLAVHYLMHEADKGLRQSAAAVLILLAVRERREGRR